MDLDTLVRIFAGIVILLSVIMLIVTYIEERSGPSEFWSPLLFIGALLLLISMSFPA